MTSEPATASTTPAQGTYEDGDRRLSWSHEGVSWEGPEGSGRVAGTGRVTRSRGVRWPGFWASLTRWNRARPMLQATFEDARGATLSLRAEVGVCALNGLPPMRQEGAWEVPEEALRGCLEAATVAGAGRVEGADEASWEVPEARTRYQKFLLARLLNNQKSGGAFEFRDLAMDPVALLWLSLRPEVKRIHTLVLRKNRVKDLGIEALFASPYLSPLRILDVGRNGLTARGVEVIGGSSRSAMLRELTLDNNLMGPDAAAALKASGGAWSPCGGCT